MGSAPQDRDFLSFCYLKGVNWLAGPGVMKVIVCAAQSALWTNVWVSQSCLKCFTLCDVGSMDSCIRCKFESVIIEKMFLLIWFQKSGLEDRVKSMSHFVVGSLYSFEIMFFEFVSWSCLEKIVLHYYHYCCYWICMWFIQIFLLCFVSCNISVWKSCFCCGMKDFQISYKKIYEYTRICSVSDKTVQVHTLLVIH